MSYLEGKALEIADGCKNLTDIQHALENRTGDAEYTHIVGDYLLARTIQLLMTDENRVQLVAILDGWEREERWYA